MTRRKTHEEFLEDVRLLVEDEYTVLGGYTRTKDKLEMKHNTCGHVWEITPNNFLKGKRCPNCANDTRFKGKTQDMFVEDVNSIYEGKFAVVGEYKGSFTPIKMYCKAHEYTFSKLPKVVLSGTRICKHCRGEYMSEIQRKSEDVFLQELKNRHKGKLVCNSAYVNTHTKIDFECTACEIVFSAEPNAVLRISGCPECSSSWGEKYTKQYLIENEVLFEVQKTFPGCKDKKLLKFDFYLPEYNMLIEYDGKQHFEPVEFFGGVTSYEEQVRKDKIKTEYARRERIKLVRIPYTVTGDSIAEVLNRSIKQESKAENLTPKSKVMI